MAAIKPESGRGWGKTVRSQNNLREHIKKHRKARPKEAKTFVLIANPEAYVSENLLKYINDNNIKVILDTKVSIGTILYQPEKTPRIPQIHHHISQKNRIPNLAENMRMMTPEHHKKMIPRLRKKDV